MSYVLEQYGLNPVFPPVVDSSMMKDFVDCPSKFYLRHVLGLRKKYHMTEDYFAWGTAWHKILEVFTTTHSRVEALKTLQNFPPSIDAATDKHGRSVERMAQIFLEYADRYESQYSEFDFLRSEQFFHIYNEEYDFEWAGRMDNVRRRKRNGNIVVWDYKTASVMGKNYFEGHEFGFQCPGYVWATNQMFTEPVQEITLDVMYCLKGSFDFFQRTFRYTPHKLNEWQKNIKLWLDRMYFLRDNHLHEPEMWQKNWNECTRYGICTFADVHFLPPIGDVRLRILSDDYVEDRWNPLAQDPDE